MTYVTATDYVEPTDAELVDPVAFLGWYHRMMRLYQHNRINWACVRRINAVTNSALAAFAEGVGTIDDSCKASGSALPEAYLDSIEIVALRDSPDRTGTSRFIGMDRQIDEDIVNVRAQAEINHNEVGQGN